MPTRKQKKLYTFLSIEKAGHIQYVYEQKTRQASRIQIVYFLSIEFSSRIQCVYSKKTPKVGSYTICILLARSVFEPYTMCTRAENSTNQNIYTFSLLQVCSNTLDYPLLFASSQKKRQGENFPLPKRK